MYTEFENKDLIPRLMKMEMSKMDSLKRIKQAQKMLEKMEKEANDSLEEEDNIKGVIQNMPSNNNIPKTPAPKKKNTPAAAILNNDDEKNKKNIRVSR